MTSTLKANYKHRATKIENGLYCYRGFEIERNDDVPNGYWGRWTSNFGKITCSTLSECKVAIDEKLNIS